jgi:agmatinase
LTPVNLVGMDVVEVSPPFDQSEITAIAAAHVAVDLLCVLSAQRRK